MKNITAVLFFSLDMGSGAFGQAYPRTLKEPIIVNSTEKSIELTFEKEGEYYLSVGTSPSDIKWERSDLYVNKTITLPRNSPRPFYGIITPNNDTLIVAERKLIINDLSNFRDLGGIKTQDHRYVVWGEFYRSDELNKLLTDEFSYLNYLGIRKVYDLRSEFEIAHAKDNLPPYIDYEHFPIFADNNSGLVQGLAEKLQTGSLTKEDAEDLLLKTYESFVRDYSPKFDTLLHQILVQDEFPSVFHCTAGKDRTGFTAAMILAILNVDRQTILDEYEMTNFYTEKSLTALAQNKTLMGYGKNIPSDVITAIMSVKRRYLQAAFDVIDNEYGGIDNYITNQLGFSPDERIALIQKYTYNLDNRMDK